jgi:hypothetical protein
MEDKKPRKERTFKPHTPEFIEPGEFYVRHTHQKPNAKTGLYNAKNLFMALDEKLLVNLNKGGRIEIRHIHLSAWVHVEIPVWGVLKTWKLTNEQLYDLTNDAFPRPEIDPEREARRMRRGMKKDELEMGRVFMHRISATDVSSRTMRQFNQLLAEESGNR